MLHMLCQNLMRVCRSVLYIGSLSYVQCLGKSSSRVLISRMIELALELLP